MRAGSAAIAVMLVLVGSACGSSHAPHTLGGQSDDIPGGPATAAGGNTFDTDTHPKFKCSDLKKEDGTTCECVEAEVLGDPPNLYFILDRSGSMQVDNHWGQVQGSVLATVRALGPRANIGAALFPTGTAQCSAGTEVMSVKLGDSPDSKGRDGPTTLALANAMNVPTGGGTPTRATIEGLGPLLRALPGKTFAVLATDGGPNCQQLTCDAANCILNMEGVNGCTPGGANCCTGAEVKSCLDGDATEAAIRTLASGGVKTYVLGIPGSAAYGPLLDKLALAGGTARTSSPYYYRVDSTGVELTAALKRIAAQIVAKCDFELKNDQDPTSINVYLDDKILPQEPGNWKVEGKTVTITGAACDQIMAGDILAVRVVAGCPTVLK